MTKLSVSGLDSFTEGEGRAPFARLLGPADTASELLRALSKSPTDSSPFGLQFESSSRLLLEKGSAVA